MNMSYKFFSIPIQMLEAYEEDINQFIDRNKIISIKKELIP